MSSETQTPAETAPQPAAVPAAPAQPAPPPPQDATAEAAPPQPAAEARKPRRSGPDKSAKKVAPVDLLGPEARKERAALWREIRTALERPAPERAAGRAPSEPKDPLAEAVRRASPKARAAVKALLKAVG